MKYLLPCAVLLWTASADAAPSVKSSSYAQRTRAAGRSILRELSFDLEGDGKLEHAVVVKNRSKLSVVLLRYQGNEDEGRFVEIGKSKPGKAQRVFRFEKRRMRVGRGEDVIAVFEDPSPDDIAYRVRIVGQTKSGPGELFAHTFIGPSEQMAVSAESLGDATSEVRFMDDDGDGSVEVTWTKGPVILTLTGKKGPARFVVGAEREVFAFDAKRSRYLLRPGESLVDFLQPAAVGQAEASSQVPKIWGTAQAFWGADNDLKTAWSVLRKKAIGATLSVRLKKAAAVRMIRIVPGCAESAEAWAQHDQLRRFALTLSTGVRFSVDRTKPDRLPPGVQAMGTLPLPDGVGEQIILVLERADPLVWARLEIEAVQRGRPARRTSPEVCVSELSFH